ncbi:NADPH-dependent 7-cyano-7-deazaguanine reductase QueF [Orrella sp. JC864]|uniref:NADPH-dependent 7-cyano-7-deazaguanine reductase QueF n=1 Tax=Orrella sp. JC864 TaxID=3120298 RepID=UPI0012BBCD25
MTPLAHAPLGQTVAYPSQYDPGLLFPIERAPARAELGLPAGAALPFDGVDIWNAYELSWLDPRGKPRVALARFQVPAASACLIESKSLKLYLNSYNQTPMADAQAVRDRIAADLARAAGAAVGVELILPQDYAGLSLGEPAGRVIDELDVDIDAYAPDAGLLGMDTARGTVQESLVSRLLKSNCPVTGQPDWATVQVSYRGPAIDAAGLLRYIVSFRQHSGFHEQCVERMFLDIQARCRPERLSVYARYTRRGGLDINPWRGTPGLPPPAEQRTPSQ